MKARKKKERKKKVGWMNVFCDLPIAMFSDRISVCRTRAYTHIAHTTHNSHNVYCMAYSVRFNIATISCARLQLQLYYCPLWRSSPRGFCLPRTCYDLLLSFSTFTPDVMEKRGPMVVINDLFTNRTASIIVEYLSNLYKKTWYKVASYFHYFSNERKDYWEA